MMGYPIFQEWVRLETPNLTEAQEFIAKEADIRKMDRSVLLPYGPSFEKMAPDLHAYLHIRHVDGAYEVVYFQYDYRPYFLRKKAK